MKKRFTRTAERKLLVMRLGMNKYFTKLDYRLDQIIVEIKEFLDSKETA